jgi:hypothetical protein
MMLAEAALLQKVRARSREGSNWPNGGRRRKRETETDLLAALFFFRDRADLSPPPPNRHKT